jgi:2-keto-3-deoxy-L-arabinonate dehydratase
MSANMSDDTANDKRASLDTSAFPPLRSVIPILVTPFADDGSVDFAQLDAQIEFLVDAGVGWAGFGFGSESPRLAEEELEEAMARAVASAAGRLGIVGNAAMTSVAGGVEAVRRVRRAGAQLSMVRPSGLEGVGEDELFETVAAVAAGGGLPLVVQDAPQNTGVQMPPRFLARLLREVPRVAAVKVEPPGPAPKMSRIVEELSGEPGVIIGGSGGLDYLHELERGAVGTMPGPAYPEIFRATESLHAAGERREAFRLFSRVLPLMTLCNRGMETFLYVQKHVLVRRGVLTTAHLRRPHRPLDDRLSAEVDGLLDVLGILELLDQCRTITSTCKKHSTPHAGLKERNEGL